MRSSMHYTPPQQVEAVILDWAGTVVDFGSFAPTKIFVEAFASFGIEISLQQARGPMGMGKWDHIRTLCNEPSIVAFRAQKLAHRNHCSARDPESPRTRHQSSFK